MALDASIIIVNWNTCDILCDCLTSIYAHTRGVAFEIIVVDNGSDDDSVSMIKTKFPEVILVDNDTNRGFSTANNQGMDLAQGRYVLLLNSDTLLFNNAVRDTVQLADTRPEAAVLGCRVLNPDKTVQPTCFMCPSLLNMLLSSSYLYKFFPKSRFFGRERMTWWNRNDVREVDVVTGCFMLVRREAIREVNGMDEQFFMYGEETDWCYRFKQAGWKILFTPDAEIIHLGGASSKQTKPEMILQLRGSILLFLRKHKSPATYTIACGLVAMFFLLRVPYWIGAAIFTRQKHHACLKTAKLYAEASFKTLGGAQCLCMHR